MRHSNIVLTPFVVIVAAVLVAGCAGGDANKTVVRGYLETLLLEQDWQRWDEYFAPDARINDSPRAREILSSMGRGLKGAFPDLELEILDQIAERDTVATRVRFRGTHLGAFDATAPTGEVVSFDAVLVDRLEDGRVIESWHQVDVMGLSRRVRAIAAGRQRAE